MKLNARHLFDILEIASEDYLELHAIASMAAGWQEDANRQGVELAPEFSDDSDAHLRYAIEVIRQLLILDYIEIIKTDIDPHHIQPDVLPKKVSVEIIYDRQYWKQPADGGEIVYVCTTPAGKVEGMPRFGN